MTYLTTWQFEPFVSVPAAVLAVCYLAAARRPARPWPRGRTFAFLAGLSAVTLATQGWPGLHDDTSLAAHMIQHLLLIMVAPPLLIIGRPVTLLLHAVRNPWHTRVKRLVRSRPLTALTWPPAGVALYSAVVLGTHLTGLLLARGAVHDAEHCAYLAAGYLYFLPVVGSEPIRWRVSVLGRYLLLLAAMPADLVTGAVLMLHGPLGPYGAGDVHAAGVIMLAGSDLVMTGLAVALAAALVTERGSRGAGPAADLAAYNAQLAALEVPKTGGVRLAGAGRGNSCAARWAARKGIDHSMGARTWIEGWPAYRQAAGTDRLGRGAAVKSPATSALTARTASADKVVKSVCPYCAVGCGQDVYVKDEKVVQIEGDPDSPVSRGRLCPKGSASLQLTTGSAREYQVLYRQPHGAEWQTLPLDQAMDMIADRVIAARRDGWQWETEDGKRVRRTLGFASLGGATLDNEENYLIKKLFTALGAVQIENQARI